MRQPPRFQPIARDESDIAYKMKKLGEDTQNDFPSYFCWWAAFNACYIALAKRKHGQLAKLRHDCSGKVCKKPNGDVEVPKANPVRENKQIKIALNCFPQQLKADLLAEKGHLDFFVERRPKWEGQEVAKDADGQCLNGVINVGYTSMRDYPVWAPISRRWYQQYRSCDKSPEVVDGLTRQIVHVLYTVRNNLFHGGKAPSGEADPTVIKHALPLLKIIVTHLLGINTN